MGGISSIWTMWLNILGWSSWFGSGYRVWPQETLAQKSQESPLQGRRHLVQADPGTWWGDSRVYSLLAQSSLPWRDMARNRPEHLSGSGCWVKVQRDMQYMPGWTGKGLASAVGHRKLRGFCAWSYRCCLGLSIPALDFPPQYPRDSRKDLLYLCGC